MKNILYLHAGAEMYGADKILLEIISGIDRSKYNPIVVLPNDGVLVTELKKLDIDVYIVNYPILRRKYFNFKGMLNYLVQYKIKIKEIYKIIEDKEIDIIHVNTTAVLEGISLKRKCHAKLLWHVHEIITNPKFVNYFICFLLGAFADKIVAVSEATKNNIVKSKLVSSNKIYVVHNGIKNSDIQLKQCGYLFDEFKINTSSRRIGMIGRINSWKGQKDFVDALVPILENHKDTFAFIIGGVFDGEEWRVNDLKEYINKTSVANRFILSNFRNDTEYLFKFFDIFVMPSIRPDPFPTVVLEAMSAGKPIVGYNHGGVTEMVRQSVNGFLSKPKCPQGITESIEKLLDDKSILEDFGQQSQRMQRELFSIKKFNERFDELYESL